MLGNLGHPAVRVLQRISLTASVYIDHLRGPVTFAPVAERFTVALSLSVFMTFATGFLACEANALQ